MIKKYGKTKTSKSVKEENVSSSVNNAINNPINISNNGSKINTAKKATAAFIGSYNYMQPGRSTQYDLGTDNYNGLTDIPVYIALMNEKNGGCLYFPTNLKQKYSYYRYFYRCFLNEDILITMFDGSQKKLSDVEIGDSLLNIYGKQVIVERKIQREYFGKVVRIQAEGIDGCIQVTQQHPFYVIENNSDGNNGVWKPAVLLSVNQFLVNKEFLNGTVKIKKYKILKIQQYEYNGVVYNINTNGVYWEDRTFYANGILTHNCDPYVGAAIDLHTDLPMSKLSLKMPAMSNEKRRQYIKKKYQHMVQQLDLYTKLRDILFEYWLIGTCYCYLQYNQKTKQFDKIVILPPQDCNITNYPFSNESVIAYNQQQIIQLVKRLKALSSDYSGVSNYLNDEIYTSSLSQIDKKILQNIPQQLLQHVFKNETILFDTDPYSGGSIGSFAFVVTRRKHSYATLGASLLQRVFVPLMQKVHYTYTQWALASRNMTPRNKLTAPQVNPDQLQELRQQFDASMNMPQYAIVTNYDWNWEIIGADNRLIDLGRQYQVIQNQIFAGLGVTRQVLCGQGMYSSGHINVQIMNARYLLVRDTFKKIVQDKIFKPIAQQNGFYDIDEDGFKHYYYPKLAFERLSIIDNDQNFDKLFNLYQKGSLPIGYIYEILNIDEQQATQKLRKDMFTVKDATFNEMIRQSYNKIGDTIVDNSDLSQLVAQNMYAGGKKIKFNKSEQSDDSDSDNPFGESEDIDNPFESNNNSKENYSEDQSKNQSEQNQNNEQQKEKEQKKQKMFNDMIQVDDNTFEDFIKTQQLAVQDDDIREFLKMQNKYVVKNKQLKEFINDYFLRPTNKDVDTFAGMVDNEYHVTNKMFENFLQTLNIQKPTNKDVEQFMKMFFLKPTNKQIEQFLRRYNKLQITDDDLIDYLNQNKQQSKSEQVNDSDIEQFLNSKQGEEINNNDVNNFELTQNKKFEI